MKNLKPTPYDLIRDPKLLEAAPLSYQVSLPETLEQLIKSQAWNEVDALFTKLFNPHGSLRKKLLEIAEFDHIEHLISIRSAPNDEEGIWHDDGSRTLGFTIGLTCVKENIMGGMLEFRKKGDQKLTKLLNYNFGHMTVFPTGIFGYEHRVQKVTRGNRLLVAGWCTSL